METLITQPEYIKSMCEMKTRTITSVSGLTAVSTKVINYQTNQKCNQNEN